MERSEMDKSFLGKGLSFPLQINSRGEIAMAAGEVDIEQSIRIILSTMPGERMMRPEFGCRVHELIFAPRDATTDGLIIYYVEQALGRWEPRIDVTKVEVSNDPLNDGAIIVDIKYEVKNTHDKRSIIYPFFIMDEGDR